jgi:isopentenyl-diphosphate Delta-isomerase
MDSSPGQIGSRKDDHIRINLEENVTSKVEVGFDQYYFLNNSLPEIDLKEVKLDLKLFSHSLQAPLFISSMTGGTDTGTEINIRLAEAAQAKGIALALGSQRAGLLSSKVGESYNLRKWAPSIPIFSNLGAIQLNNGCTVEDCQKIVDMANSDALILHLNPLQEALQPEGETNFSGLIKKIGVVCTKLSVPVIVKEVGWGISGEVADKLVKVGVAAIDVAGAGGTSWSEVEKHRNQTQDRIRISSHFRDWGIPTADSIQLVKKAVPGVTLFASGGIRRGLDVAKCVAMGATICGMAGPFLKPANESTEAVISIIDEILLELKISMFAAGAGNLDALHKTPLLLRSK